MDCRRTPREGETGVSLGADGGKCTGIGENNDGTTSDLESSGKRTVRRFVDQGEVPVESWGELFRCFVGPAARMPLKKPGLGVRFEMALPDDGALSEDDAVLKAMREAAHPQPSLCTL